MERNLVLIDKEYLIEQKDRLKRIIENIKDEVCVAVKKTRTQFNLASTQQLGNLLFEELKYDYPEGGKTKTDKYRTDDATLSKMTKKYPIVKKILSFRELEKSLGTYVENLLANCDKNNCIKFNLNQVGTDTGPFSSSGGFGIKKDGYCGVNAQNIPDPKKAESKNINLPDIRRADYCQTRI